MMRFERDSFASLSSASYARVIQDRDFWQFSVSELLIAEQSLD